MALDLIFGPDGWGPAMFRGFLITMLVAIVAYIVSVAGGILWSLAARSERRVPKFLWRVYRSIFTGVPPLLVIFFIFYNLPIFVSEVLGLKFDVSPFAAGVIALGLVFSAYLAEVFRGAYLDVSKGQFEAAAALGLGTYPTYVKVILPQVFRLALPGMSNIWLIVLKDTAYLSLIGLTDIVRVSVVAANSTNRPFLFFIAAGVVFIVLALLTARGMRALEARMDRPYIRSAT